MIEVGKKYKGVARDIVWTCLYADEVQMIMQASNTKSKIHFLVGEVGVWWQEYVEPKVEKFFRTVHKGRCGYFTSIPEDFEEPVGKIELTITDGKLTNVEIVE